jgi:hypothetical protein
MLQYPDIPVGVSMLGQYQLEAGIGRHRLCRHEAGGLAEHANPGKNAGVLVEVVAALVRQQAKLVAPVMANKPLLVLFGLANLFKNCHAGQSPSMLGFAGMKLGGLAEHANPGKNAGVLVAYPS